MAGLVLFLLKRGSRNSLNNLRNEEQFRKNYRRLFRQHLPHLDTVDAVMRALPEEALETLKHKLIQILLEKKVWHNKRLFKKYFLIAIDATRVLSFDHKHCEQCLHTTHKSGKVTYFHNVLEAKLITPSGFCVSLMTVWVENPKQSGYDKQDCELKAFARLATRLKQAYPRLPMCIAADSLYPSEGFFKICKANNWRYILTFKDGTIPSIASEAVALSKLNPQKLNDTFIKGKTRITQDYRWSNNINYQGYNINWIECIKTKPQLDKDPKITRFVHLTDLSIDSMNAIVISNSGRLRWKIENEGFNEQKNLGFSLRHKYSRVDYLAMKNYYQCLQIAHLFMQLIVLNDCFKAMLKGNQTRKHIWEQIIGFLSFVEICSKQLRQQTEQKIQVRFTT